MMHNISLVDLLRFPFRRFLGDARREFLQRLPIVLHGILGSYRRDALQEGCVDAVACLHASRPQAYGISPSFFILLGGFHFFFL
jgi:hypothetical protein